MASVEYKIEGLEHKQPLFREFCFAHELKDGDYYRPVDFLLWSQDFTIPDVLRICRKYDPSFSFSGCNL